MMNTINELAGSVVSYVFYWLPLWIILVGGIGYLAVYKGFKQTLPYKYFRNGIRLAVGTALLSVLMCTFLCTLFVDYTSPFYAFIFYYLCLGMIVGLSYGVLIGGGAGLLCGYWVKRSGRTQLPMAAKISIFLLLTFIVVLPVTLAYIDESGIKYDLKLPKIAFEPIDLKNNIYYSSSGESQIVVNSRREYENFLNSVIQTNKKNFLKKPKPPIDFTKETILVFWTYEDCRTRDFQRKVYKDSFNKKIIYQIRARKVEHGGMRCVPWSNPNLIRIPKIPPDYTVEFVQVK